MTQHNRKNLLGFLMTSLMLSGCGADNSDLNGRNSGKGMLTVSITDAAVDSATAVWVQFTGVEIKPEEGKSLHYDFEKPVSINLLNLQGSLSQAFFNNSMVDSGRYNWARLKVKAELDGTLDSYIKLDDGSEHELEIPSSAQTGLKVNTPFDVTANASNQITIDFDLRKSIVFSTGDYKLKPSLRLVNNKDTNTVTGSFDISLASDAGCSDADPLTGNAVYLYEGHDIIPDDIDNKTSNPVTTALLSFNALSGNLDYELGFIPTGDYTLAFTCQADLDMPETDDVIVFSDTSNITVTAPETDITNLTPIR